MAFVRKAKVEDPFNLYEIDVNVPFSQRFHVRFRSQRCVASSPDARKSMVTDMAIAKNKQCPISESGINARASQPKALADIP